MAEVVEPKIFDLGGSQGRWNDLLRPPKVTIALTIGKYKRRGVKRPWKVAEDATDGRGHRNVACITVL